MSDFSDLISTMVLQILGSSEWTSASPGHINTFIGANAVDSQDFEVEIKKIVEQINKEKLPDINKSPTSSTEFKPTDILSKLSREDAQGILGKAGIDPKNIPNLLKMTTSGQGITGAALGIGGGFAASVLPPAMVVLLIAQLIPLIIKELQRPGGFFDKRVKIDARNEAFSVLDRQTRQNTRIGDRQVTIQQFEGFRNFEGYASTSTGELITKNADRVLDIGLFDRAQGVSSR